jgi:hypothetical protein
LIFATNFIFITLMAFVFSRLYWRCTNDATIILEEGQRLWGAPEEEEIQTSCRDRRPVLLMSETEDGATIGRELRRGDV